MSNIFFKMPLSSSHNGCREHSSVYLGSKLDIPPARIVITQEAPQQREEVKGLGIVLLVQLQPPPPLFISAAPLFFKCGSTNKNQGIFIGGAALK